MNRPIRILIIDDNKKSRLHYRELLEQTEDFVFTFRELEDGHYAQEHYEKYKPDVVLLEYSVGAIDGLDVIKVLTNGNPIVNPCPIVFITGHGSEQIAAQAIKLGAQEYLSKNEVTRETLIAKITLAIESFAAYKANINKQLKLEHEANHDHLTGLYNRRHFDSVLYHEMCRSKRYNRPLSLIVLDLDKFKYVNDTYGHAVGDDVLRAVASTLKSRIRDVDIACRFGGDEFCVILPETHKGEAIKLSEYFYEGINDMEISINTKQVMMASISIGIAEFDSTITDPLDFFKRADDELYKHKRSKLKVAVG